MEHTASRLQSETQSNGPNLDRANSLVRDESPGISNQTDIGESGNFLDLIRRLFVCKYFFDCWEKDFGLHFQLLVVH